MEQTSSGHFSYRAQASAKGQHTAQSSVDEVIAAARSDHKLDHFKVGEHEAIQTSASATAHHLHHLAWQFEQTFHGLPGFHEAHSINPFQWPWQKWGDDIQNNLGQVAREIRVHALAAVHVTPMQFWHRMMCKASMIASKMIPD